MFLISILLNRTIFRQGTRMAFLFPLFLINIRIIRFATQLNKLESFNRDSEAFPFFFFTIPVAALSLWYGKGIRH